MLIYNFYIYDACVSRFVYSMLNKLTKHFFSGTVTVFSSRSHERIETKSRIAMCEGEGGCGMLLRDSLFCGFKR